MRGLEQLPTDLSLLLEEMKVKISKTGASISLYIFFLTLLNIFALFGKVQVNLSSY